MNIATRAFLLKPMRHFLAPLRDGLEVPISGYHAGDIRPVWLMNDDTSLSRGPSLRDDPPPTPPVEPDPGDCCGNGCDPCIFDDYAEARQHYRQLLAAWRERHPGVDPASLSSTPPASDQCVP
jgi:hypothetical protein